MDPQLCIPDRRSFSKCPVVFGFSAWSKFRSCTETGSGSWGRSRPSLLVSLCQLPALLAVRPPFVSLQHRAVLGLGSTVSSGFHCTTCGEHPKPDDGYRHPKHFSPTKDSKSWGHASGNFWWTHYFKALQLANIALTTSVSIPGCFHERSDGHVRLTTLILMKILYIAPCAQGKTYVKFFSGETIFPLPKKFPKPARVTGTFSGSRKIGNFYRCNTETTAAIALVLLCKGFTYSQMI